MHTRCIGQICFWSILQKSRGFLKTLLQNIFKKGKGKEDCLFVVKQYSHGDIRGIFFAERPKIISRVHPKKVLSPHSLSWGFLLPLDEYSKMRTQAMKEGAVSCGERQRFSATLFLCFLSSTFPLNGLGFCLLCFLCFVILSQGVATGNRKL